MVWGKPSLISRARFTCFVHAASSWQSCLNNKPHDGVSAMCYREPRISMAVVLHFIASGLSSSWGHRPANMSSKASMASWNRGVKAIGGEIKRLHVSLRCSKINVSMDEIVEVSIDDSGQYLPRMMWRLLQPSVSLSITGASLACRLHSSFTVGGIRRRHWMPLWPWK